MCNHAKILSFQDFVNLNKEFDYFQSVFILAFCKLHNVLTTEVLTTEVWKHINSPGTKSILERLTLLSTKEPYFP